MANYDEILNWYQTFTPNPEQRKNWYGSVAETYDRVRPKYDRAFLARALAVAEVPQHGRILEIGCGPGTATRSLAQMGYYVVALEPSLEACEIARQHVAAYANVEIINTNFEEWEPENRSFDAILAATSWHWVAPDHKHLKVAFVLKDRGALVLLWNSAMQPPSHIFAHLAEVIEGDLPTFATFKDRDTELSEIRVFATIAIESGLFVNLIEEYRSHQVDYSIDDYLQLLTTYSPWIALAPERRRELLESLRILLAQKCGDLIPLAYVSIFHVASKR
ncbi:class I SAM-dependent methyltransferase [Chamaesiphon minutus]|uniref:Methylase involved in ubiquinone/menaquinone biosynthesis n=1 Tax=Chamaesiphon minutus (strain ATCC 27169 / PCC 6605) TaxID=1173020 RepID=K9U984_CHAP6|nr:class I SAM-dependent methyltransferase [Chamaesiphon minutus]AFY91662.1 methylase involved in ubiquinone/menaquinone biosynthesis [Chamaesiphon minutus PCC 6605]